jgi:lipoprotein-anchoring transpeptidase ErfK/SrfK
MDSQITSGRRRRPLATLLATLALVGLTASGAVAASPKTATSSISPRQVVATLLVQHQARAKPSSKATALELVPAKAPLTEGRTALPVLGQRGKWLRVRLPGRPNSHTGWIMRAGTTLSVTVWHLVVDRSRREVIVYKAGRKVHTFAAVVGKPSTPTPTGQFFVEESIALSAGDVGAPFALALSARSNVFQEFEGGPGQIALHGLDNVGGDLGTAESHGCIRMADDTMRWLVVRIGAGAPVTITD